MASNTSDFKPFKVSQMFSRLADLYPTSSATLPLIQFNLHFRFEAKRVIIRQGHKAENFYFILSGTGEDKHAYC